MRRFMTITQQALAGAALLFAGCDLAAVGSEPMGKQLERALKEIEKDCRRREAPPFGPGSREYKDTSCLMFTLKPWEPGDTPESAFAHSIKLPPPHDKPKDVYKASMSSEEYFQALCRAESGEWVFRRVEGVKGLRQDRPKFTFPSGSAGIVYYTVEKGYYMDTDMAGYLVAPRDAPYEFLDLRSFEGKNNARAEEYKRFVRGLGATGLSTAKPTVDANYAFVWRGIRRPNDRVHAIEGDELIIYQIQPFEVLAFRRLFSYHYLDKTNRDKSTPSGKGCRNATSLPHTFIEAVLIPSTQKSN